MKLFWNTSFEHSREERYWCCFDLLTQSFFGAVLEKMAAVARQHRQEWYGERWSRKLELLREGIREHLTQEDAGKTVYMEMRLPDENAGKAYEGMGWVNYGPIAADWEALPHEIMRNTVESLRRRLWKEDPDADGLYFYPKTQSRTAAFVWKQSERESAGILKQRFRKGITGISVNSFLFWKKAQRRAVRGMYVL